MGMAYVVVYTVTALLCLVGVCVTAWSIVDTNRKARDLRQGMVEEGKRSA